ncbi:MAG: RNA polymerase sigma factor [SAR86 cluster bacterium]|uniref:RNA polymerase sigma factor n=1 Tax=SAR86 cluster bacterium TaxID=2030880 RepID=A0A2A5C8U8_9GAMM|nr:MAG: RNA polymerase sigma factor [SAR86 cluster bacterium]
MSSLLVSSYGSLFTLGYDIQSNRFNLRKKSLDNSQALGSFFTSIEKRAFRRAQIATGNADDALDIVQDAMVSLINKYANKETQDWELLFHKILTSRIMDWHRRTAIRKRFGTWLSSNDKELELEEPEFEDLNARSPEELMQTSQSIAMLEAALHELSPKQQQVFLLRAWEGLSEKETSVAMSCSVGTIKSHYARARSFLKNKLEAKLEKGSP